MKCHVFQMNIIEIHNTGLYGSCKVEDYKSMTYHHNKKARKIWSDQANAKKARLIAENGERDPFVILDPYIKITIERRATGEDVVIECFEGGRIDNYSVYCDGEPQGIQSITTITKNIRKAIPRFRNMEY